MSRLGDWLRRPTPAKQLYAWHTNAVRGHLAEDMPLTEDPQCGWFKRRLVKNGPFVAAQIWMYQPIDPATGELEADETLRCEVSGKFAEAADQWVWLCQNPIAKAEFDYITATQQWAVENAPDEPMANPREPTNWSKVPTPNFT